MAKTMQRKSEAAGRGAQIVCLQELYRTRYFPQEENANAAHWQKPSLANQPRRFSALAKKHRIVIIAPIFEKNPNGKFYNSAVVIDADGEFLGYLPQNPRTL